MDLPELPITYRGAVYPWQCDHMGHMNVTWYTGKFDEATWQLFNLAGITPSYLREQQRAMAGVEQRTAYKAELWPGDVVTVRSGVLEVREKAIRFFHEMRNEDTGVIAAITVLVAVHLDAQTRKSCALPAAIAAAAQRLLVAYDPGV